MKTTCFAVTMIALTSCTADKQAGQASANSAVTSSSTATASSAMSDNDRSVADCKQFAAAFGKKDVMDGLFQLGDSDEHAKKLGAALEAAAKAWRAEPRTSAAASTIDKLVKFAEARSALLAKAGEQDTPEPASSAPRSDKQKAIDAAVSEGAKDLLAGVPKFKRATWKTLMAQKEERVELWPAALDTCHGVGVEVGPEPAGR